MEADEADKHKIFPTFQACDYCGGWHDQSFQQDEDGHINIFFGISDGKKLIRKCCSRCFLYMMDKVIPIGEDERKNESLPSATLRHSYNIGTGGYR